MTSTYQLIKLFTRQGHPDFLDLPWDYSLEEWEKGTGLTERLVQVEKGRSRHTVLFVHYEKVYAIKELPDDMGQKEYQTLREIEKREIPAVKPVGYALLEEKEGRGTSSILITEYLKSSIPYWSIFMRSDLYMYQDSLLDALAVLLVTLHLKGIFWGDCSLSNILFKRDAGELQAYFVDAETSEIHPTISKTKRDYDLSILEENVAGELMDLSVIVDLPDELDIYEVSLQIHERYEALWSEITSDEVIRKSERYKINEKIQRINDLGFTVEEIEITTTGAGDEIRIQPIVTDRNYHQQKLQDLTGFITEENVARKLLSEIFEVKTWLTKERKENITLNRAARLWVSNNFLPAIQQLDLEKDDDTALQAYAEIIDLRHRLAEKDQRWVSSEEAVEKYLDQILSKREMHLFSRGMRRFRHKTRSEVEISKREVTVDWKNRAVYQIYPRSFYDSDANGVGDIPGIIQKLEYLEWLGVTAIRLNSVFKSPMHDFGYDISLFKGIEPMFGTMDDFNELIHRCRQRDIKVILDIVLNHTSIEHPWFQESSKSRDNPYRDWYIWKDPRPDGGPPNNWLSLSGASAWTYHEQTEQYYLHSFLETEPDLNWEDKQLRDKMLNVIRFWLQHGVDGIVLVMLAWIAKDPQFRDDPENPNYDAKEDLPYSKNIPIYSYDRPHLVDYVVDIHNTLMEFRDRLSFAQLDLFAPMEHFLKDYKVAELIDIPLNLRLLDLDWNPTSVREFIDNYDAAVPSGKWPNYTLGSHDFPRVANRLGEAQGRIAAVLLLTLRGIPFLYYGDEIAMKNIRIPSEYMQDPWEEITLGTGRDPQRTPMQWDSQDNAGFSQGKAWLPVADNYREKNVQRMSEDSQSILYLYRSLLQLRKEEQVLITGTYRSLDTNNPHCLVYERENEKNNMRIYLNFSSTNQRIPVKNCQDFDLELTTYLDGNCTLDDDRLILRADEGVILKKIGQGDAREGSKEKPSSDI